MERYLEIRITESGKVGEVLRAEAGLTKRQISQAKFRPGGILKNGKQCRVTEIAVPGDRLQVCLEAKGIDSKQLVCPDTGSFIEQGKKQLLDFERQEMEDGLKLQKLQILYEDQDLLVVNKPAGMVTHPSGSHSQDSISNLLAAYFREKNETTRIRSIGRLDKGAPPGFYFLPEPGGGSQIAEAEGRRKAAKEISGVCRRRFIRSK